MALEFTRLSDVALVEEATDTANVLIEEGGEIKRVPKTAVRGAGAGEPDGIIYNTLIPIYISTSSVSIINFDFAAIKEKFLAGEEVVVMLHSVFSYGNDYEIWDKSVSASYNSIDNTISFGWLSASNYNSGNAGMSKITITIDSSDSIVHVERY